MTETEQILTDKQRILKILKILPEENVEVFTDDLWNSYYHRDFLKNLEQYKKYSETVMSQFSNSDLERHRKNFNKAFDLLNDFLGRHFFPASNIDFHRLEPDLKGHPDKEPLYREYQKKLHKLVKDFDKNYKKLIKLALGYIKKEERAQAKSKIAEIPKKTSEKKFPHRIPAGAKWEYITIKFLDDENVFIKVHKFEVETSYKDMGFEDKRSSNPDQQWALLKIFAKYNGEINWKSNEANERHKKTKELLAKTLQKYFRIDYDPFHPYHSAYSGKEKKSYKIKITLIPPPESETPQKLPKEEKDVYEDIDEVYEEQTPQVYDPFEQ